MKTKKNKTDKIKTLSVSEHDDTKPISDPFMRIYKNESGIEKLMRFILHQKI